jgi:DNA polymerase/3'-5' exonuclease PolX
MSYEGLIDSLPIDDLLSDDSAAGGASSPKVKMPAGIARPVAEQIRTALASACARIEIAGSLRRRKETVGDIEIVCLPITDTDLFGDTLATSGALDRALACLVASGRLAWDTVLKRNGNRYKRFVVPPLGGAGLDLFIAERDNWGNILAIRTGSAEFSSAIMKKRSRGGYLPDELRQEAGYLWRLSGIVPKEVTRLACPTEEAFFETLGVPWLPPEKRDLATLTKATRDADDAQ